MTIRLVRMTNRSINAPHATIGSIRLEQGIIFTMEKPWVIDPKYPKQGKSLQSCVPAGVYNVYDIEGGQMYLESAINGISLDSASGGARVRCGIGLSERTESNEPNIIPGLTMAMVDLKLRPIKTELAYRILAESLKKDPRLSIVWE